MRIASRKMLAAGGATALLLGGAGAALAAGGSTAKAPSAHALIARSGHAGRGLGRRVVVKASAAYLGLKPAEIRAELKSGRSLAQIAQAHGKTSAGLQQAIVAAETVRLDKAVARGKLTAAREQAILQKLQARLPALLARVAAHA